LVAEQLVTVKTKTGHVRTEWQQLRDRNEALDCRVYARAAAWLLGIDRWDDSRWEQRELTIGQVASRSGGGVASPAQQVAPDLIGNNPYAAVPKREQTWIGPRSRRWF
jgi:phage terminase large subunit GpA-like protein